MDLKRNIIWAPSIHSQLRELVADLHVLAVAQITQLDNSLVSIPVTKH